MTGWTTPRFYGLCTEESQLERRDGREPVAADPAASRVLVRRPYAGGAPPAIRAGPDESGSMAVDDVFNESFRGEYDRQNESLGRFNLGLFGKTGVGKS